MNELNIDDIIGKHIEEIQCKRNELIFNRLNELGIQFSIEDESKRRFKRLSREFKNNEETFYFNDGSIDGLRIITFVTENSFDPVNFKFDVITKWY